VLDGVGLTKLFHKMGVNMRYLGRVATLAEKLEKETAILTYLKVRTFSVSLYTLFDPIVVI
jgi:hypothetical protein